MSEQLSDLLDVVENESLRFGTRSNQEHWARMDAARRAVFRVVALLLVERDTAIRQRDEAVEAANWLSLERERLTLAIEAAVAEMPDSFYRRDLIAALALGRLDTVAPGAARPPEKGP